MNAHSKIMVACDLSDYSFKTIRCGARLAADLGAEMIIVNIINQRDIMAMQNAILKLGTQVDNFPTTIGEYVAGVKEERIADIRKLIA